ncbi:MAG: ABC transporter ATP-binding protein [Planctomycetota bacterium]
MSILAARDLVFSYEGRRVLSGVSFEVEPGEFLGLIGPNGAGKSTLLRVLLGFLTPSSGSVILGGESLSSLERDEIARRLSFLPQGARMDFAFSVREVVAMGRTPWLGRFKPETPEDQALIEGAMVKTETATMRERRITELSGGERQRVFLARSMAQAAPLLVLDEPNANLDLLHAFQLMDLVKSEVSKGASALVAIHDLSLAARVCDRILVLKDGAVAALGRPSEVLTPKLLHEVFGVHSRISHDDDGRLLVSVLGPAA